MIEAASVRANTIVEELGRILGENRVNAGLAERTFFSTDLARSGELTLVIWN